MNTTTPTAADLLINSLQPKQRAILYSALLFFKNEAENAHAAHIEQQKMAPTLHIRISEYFRWNFKEAKELINLLFSDCFPEDLEPLQFFTKELPPIRKVVSQVGL